MILHLSISARDPAKVAEILAEITGGKCIKFPSVPDSYMCVTNDGHGTCVEVYPENLILRRGDDGEQPFQIERRKSPSYSATHFAITVNKTAEEIRSIADREGWHASRQRRAGKFNVCEFWLEDRLLVEFIAAEDLDEALTVLKAI